jgi:20S proteasome alpha/beta subunit
VLVPFFRDLKSDLRLEQNPFVVHRVNILCQLVFAAILQKRVLLANVMARFRTQKRDFRQMGARGENGEYSVRGRYSQSGPMGFSLGLTIILAWIALGWPSVAAKSASNISPIRNFEPSLAASSAQGTTISVSYPRDGSRQQTGIVVVFRSPYKGGSVRKKSAKTDWTLIDGIRVRPTSSDTATNSESSHRWTLLSDALCCMTGLASDVDYLSRCIQKQVDTHRVVYEGTRVFSALQLVRVLCELLQEATKGSSGGRPYGVQALIVGTSPTRDALQMYTVDPSGGFRHWGTGTAIGRGAALVRKHVYRQNITNQTPPTCAKEALEVALRASFSANKELFDANADDPYQALLVWTDEQGRFRVGSIDESVIDEFRERISIDNSGSSA